MAAQQHEQAERIAFRTCFAALSIMVVALVFGERWLPFLDAGAHVQFFDIVQRYHDSATTYDDVYEFVPTLAPNIASLLLAKALTGIIDANTYCKLLFAAGMVALPASMTALARQTGRTPWLGLVGFALCVNKTTIDGFVNWTVGMPLIFFVAASVAWFRGRGSRGRDALLPAGLIVAVFLVHGLAWLAAIFIASFWLLFSGRTWREQLWTIVIPLPGALIAFPALLADKAPPTGTFEWRSLVGRIEFLGRASTDVLNNGVGLWHFCGLLVLLVALWSIALVSHRRVVPFDVTALVGVVAALLYLVAPVHVPQFYSFSDRFAVPLLASLVLLPNVRRLSPELLIALCPSLLATVGFLSAVQVSSHRFNYDHLQDEEFVVSQVPEGAWLGSAEIRDHPELRTIQAHFSTGMHAVLNGGGHAGGFQRAMTAVVRFQTNRMPAWPAFPPLESAEAREMEYFVVQSEEPPIFVRRSGFETVAQRGDYWLFRTTTGRSCIPGECAGGSGGRRRGGRCANGEHIRRIRVAHIDDQLRGLGFVCTPDEDPLVFDWPRVDLSDELLEYEQLTELSCAASEDVVGVSGHLSSQGEWIRTVGVVCRDRTSGVHRQADSIGVRDIGRYELVCPVGEQLVGLVGQSDRGIDRVKIHCGSVAAPTADVPSAEDVPPSQPEAAEHEEYEGNSQ